MTTDLSFKIHGMDCAEEIISLRREIGPLVGGEEALSFDILSGKMTVTPSKGEISSEAILRVVGAMGMRAEVWKEEPADAPGAPVRRPTGRTLLSSLSGLFLAAGFLSHAWLAGSLASVVASEGSGVSHHVPLPAKILYALGIVAGVWYVLPKAWGAARRLRPDMNLLMTTAVLGAIGIGEWLEAATVSFLFAASLALESWSIGRARRVVATLMDLTPPTARLKRQDGSEEVVGPDAVPVGSILVVKPGERIPLDGRVARGDSEVNQAPITGESVSVNKRPGDPVFAGTINGSGALEIETTKPARETTLALIIRTVGEAHSKRGPSEAWVERFARFYTPAVMGLALATLLVPTLLFAGRFENWFYRSLVLLVIGCPCALVISTPVTIVAALAAAARNGVLLKGGKYAEAPARLKAIAFDKTGTLTEGKPAVVEVVPLAGHEVAEVIRLAAALEARSEHPIASAILSEARRHDIRFLPAEDFRMLGGKGATARIDGRSYWVGSHRYLEERGQETPEVHARLESMAGDGRTVVVLGDETHVCGLIALADRVRPEARPAVEALRRAGIEHVIMLTGDNEGTARGIAREAGIDEVRAELLPQDKVAAMESLVSRYGEVAMVGDGVNDAPAMARAAIGIAMGAAGSDAAIETADIALMSDDLSKLPWLMLHSRRTLSIIRQNIVFSLLVKAVFFALTFAGTASIWSAIAADMGASLLVTFNGMRLFRSTHS